ncbi:DNA topoisomerase 2 isoform X2 [Lycorma delicatula]|uniref:DNA topoisomerase 2 isoform X2 n=1 Tax=Lycorma delicatula TaxID=130591 RepID=UPI003F512359
MSMSNDLVRLTNGVSSAEEGGGGDAAPPASKPTKSSKLTVEKTYQKKSQLEHILLRPDTYIGSVETTTEPMWVYDAETQSMIKREISYVPGLFKIFDEILVNAADNKQRDPSMNLIKIDIKPEENLISVWNNGKGIPVVIHKDEKMYVPTMIFGHLLTSSNYNDEDEKVTGGRNGYGAKLCNIFSKSFIVETSSKEYKKTFRQKWVDNMTKTTEPRILDDSAEDFTKVTFSPDLEKFKMEKLDKDIVDLMSRRACDVAASTGGVKVVLNGKNLQIKSFKDYIDLYVKNKRDGDDNPLKIVHEKVNPRWEVAVTVSDHGFQQISFVNSIATTKGGRHVDYIVDMIVKSLIATIKKKNKGGMVLKPFQVKNHLWVFVNCLIVNPTFDSQTKENMTLQAKNFGSKCSLSDKFNQNVTKCGVVESLLLFAKSKEQDQLQKTSGKMKSKISGVPKLEDANDAGVQKNDKCMDCTLILTEGDSAKSLAVSGLGVIGRDKYGVFPLRGKLLNVREATHKQILENAEINNIIKILGLKYKTKYETRDDLRNLRYGRLMIMTDQDQDGSHIKGLIINFFHHFWPSLLRCSFLEEFITPIIKATKNTEVISFFSIPEFEEWKRDNDNWHKYKIKYYKGLGTSTSKEAKEYFSNMDRHRIRFKYSGEDCDKSVVMAFSRKMVDARKKWLTNWMTECKRRQELGLPEDYLYTKDIRYVTYKDFVNKELVLFSNMDIERSIPSAVDGLKPGSRKVLFTCLKRNDKREIKVAQLAGSVAEHSAYHHGEMSLMTTIINLAQNFVGSNNINLLQPIGQFGTRLQGGKDAASPRYIFTMLSPLTRLIFHPHDDPLLKYLRDDNQKVEPEWYIPIIPMMIVNGADGIGTGWMTRIPNYNPREIIDNLKKMIVGEEPSVMKPWYKNFKGEIDTLGTDRYIFNGEISIINETKVEITELPVGTWTQQYKESVLEVMLNGQTEKCPPSITDYKEYNTDTTVRFVVSMTAEKLAAAEREGLHNFFKLQSTFAITSMCAFDKDNCLKKYDNVTDILRDFFSLRLTYYDKRKSYLEGVLHAEARKLTNQARFICEKCDHVLVIENKKKKDMIAELVRRNYDSDPVKAWKLQQDREAMLEEAAGPRSQTEDDDEEESESLVPESAGPDYDYLLSMTMWTLTKEKKDELLKKRDDKMSELHALQVKTPADLWNDDLDALLIKLNEVEKKEKEEEEAGVVNPKGKGGKGKAAAGLKAKKNMAVDFMPSPTARRVAPIISDDLKKKVERLTAAKVNKGKRTKKKIGEGDEKDEFDMMAEEGMKPLEERIGNSPQLIEKKLKAKKKEKAEKGEKPVVKRGPKSPKKSPKKKKNWNSWDGSSSSNEDKSADSDSDVADVGSVIPQRQTARRSAAAKIKYQFDDDELEDDEEEELIDNAAVLNGGEDEPEIHHDLDDETFSVRPTTPVNDSEEDEKKKPKKRANPAKTKKAASPPPKKKPALTFDSDSDNDFMKKQPAEKPNESSEDMFDSLLKATKKPSQPVLLSSSDDSPVKEKPPPKKQAKAPAAAKPRKAPVKRAKKDSDSDSNSDSAVPKTKKSKKKTARDDSDSDVLDSDVEVKPRSTSVSSSRARKVVKYNYDDDDSS